jgi:hypothetical protein
MDEINQLTERIIGAAIEERNKEISPQSTQSTQRKQRNYKYG